MFKIKISYKYKWLLLWLLWCFTCLLFYTGADFNEAQNLQKSRCAFQSLYPTTRLEMNIIPNLLRINEGKGSVLLKRFIGAKGRWVQSEVFLSCLLSSPGDGREQTTAACSLLRAVFSGRSWQWKLWPNIRFMCFLLCGVIIGNGIHQQTLLCSALTQYECLWSKLLSKTFLLLRFS